MITLTSALTTVAMPAPAQAHSCPAGLQWSLTSHEWFPEYYAVQYVVDSVTPDFLVSEQRAVVNNTNTQATASFTSSVSQTFSMSVTVGTSASLFGFLTANVSASISMSTTTMTGVSASAPVPPFSRVVGQYGVEAYRVTYTENTYHNIGYNPPNDSCTLYASRQGTSVAPTVFSGWRVLPG
ncbi:hypothetical protein [Pseudosporangium ferrugineum]|uniref:hypothetical protein n=1 Tax=Pseudosporangium ferrugineum TaxID=439699 RepID=UPI0011B260B7|nr:hypothetical protein [Pseudosporangium ferrugineum]